MRQTRSEFTRFRSPTTERDLELALLGPLMVERDESNLEISGPKRRALLILLALNAGSPVSRERIVDALWPGERTGREESTLRVHVSHLRDLLEPARDGSAEVILTEGSAYLLADGVSLDIDRFDELTAEGRRLVESDPGVALGLINEALGLWRGRPLQDVEYEEFAQEDIRRLDRARLSAIEDRAEARVGLGEDAGAIDDLEALVRTSPTRERPVGLLMRALYRTGRQSDALRVFRRHSRHVAEQGLEPSPTLRHLEERILQHDPTLLPGAMAPAGDIKTGRSVRGYELREQAGQGSIGIVYRAFQASVGREVAVKAIHPRVADAPDFVRRFAEEARVVAGLEHPHIVPLYDFWRDPAGAFLVMRWMDGGSLADRLGRPWDPADIGRVFSQLSEALGYAHSAGVVHRDVKPANVLFDTTGNAYLSDFGLAVTAADTGANPDHPPVTLQPPYASPETLRREGPTVASDIYSLGVLLAEAASGSGYEGVDTPVIGGIREVVLVATAPNPADRYPDMVAFRAALLDAVGTTTPSVPRTLRRNPYKGLAPFGEGDRADFYGRDAAIESLLDTVAGNGLTAIIGASGSGKSSLVMAGLIPQLREGALPGSDEWSIVTMVPGTDPFDEFHIALRNAAVGYHSGPIGDRVRELRNSFAAALDGPNSRALLVIDQFEEVFSADVDDTTRERFLENLADLAADPAHRIRIVLTLRADFSDRPLAHPRFGPVMADASVLLTPMRPEQIEDVIRGPAARVGIQVEPGLIAEIIRDVGSAPAYLPLLQYVLAELFERRTEDRLTVQAYRNLGGVQGVLERRADATYSALGVAAQHASRHLFLRMVQLGDHGEETRRRLPLTELHGLGGRSDVDAAVEAFSTARLLTYDRDPVTRTPTVEVAHETVIRQWARYRLWIDEARADLRTHRQLSTAAATWTTADEDPAYLLVEGPLAAAADLAARDVIALNDLETQFLHESQTAEKSAKTLEEARRAEEIRLRQSSRRRLAGVIAATVIAAVVGLVATFAWTQRQRANDLAAAQERQNTARELAAASLTNLTSGDPDLSLLLAIEGAEQSIGAGEDVLPEVVDALHRAIINPRPDLIIDGTGTAKGAQLVEFSLDGTTLVALTTDGGAMVVDSQTGDELGRVPPITPPAFGVDFHPDGRRVLTIHPDGVRQWDWSSGPIELELEQVGVSTAAYSRDGSSIAIGREDGVINVWSSSSSDPVTELAGGHEGRVMSLDFGPSGLRLVSGGSDRKALVWDIASGTVKTQAKALITLPIWQVAWHPFLDVAAITTVQGEMLVFDPETGERLNSFGNGQNRSRGIAFDGFGRLLIAAGEDGFARVYGTAVGGEAAISLPAGGVPIRDAALDPIGLTAATVGLDGTLRVWHDIVASELSPRFSLLLYPSLAATPDGSRYIFGSGNVSFGVPRGVVPTIDVIDASTGESLFSRPASYGPSFTGFTAPQAISPDGSLVAFISPASEVKIVAVDRLDSTRVPHSGPWTASLAFSPDGTRLAGGGTDASIAIWDVSTGNVVGTLTGHDVSLDPTELSRVNQVVFHPDGTELASAGKDGTVRVWDPQTGEGRIVHTFDFSANSIAYASDGSLLAADDDTGTVVVLNLDSGAVSATLDSVPGRSKLVFSPDGRTLLGAGPGSITHLWDVETGRILRRFGGAVYPATSAAFINDGTEVRVASGEGIDRGYLLDPLALVELARSEVSRELTESECQQYLRKSCNAKR